MRIQSSGSLSAAHSKRPGHISSTPTLPPPHSNWFSSTDNNYNRKYLGKKVHAAVGAEREIPLLSTM